MYAKLCALLSLIGLTGLSAGCDEAGAIAATIDLALRIVDVWV